VLVPLLDAEGDETVDAGVGAVRHVQGAATQIPHQPRLDRGEAKLARFPARLLYQPARLGRRLIGRQSQSFALQHQTVDHGAKVLPPEGGTNRHATHRIKDDGGRALIGDAHDVGAARFVQRARRQLEASRAISAPSSSTSPGCGILRLRRCRRAWVTLPSVSTIAVRIDVVPTSIARALTTAHPESQHTGVHDVLGVEQSLQVLEDAEPAAECFGDEPSTVVTDAVMVTERAAVSQHLFGHALPRATVETGRVVIGSCREVK